MFDRETERCLHCDGHWKHGLAPGPNGTWVPCPSGPGYDEYAKPKPYGELPKSRAEYESEHWVAVRAARAKREGR